jgi:hypothetical protein
MSSCSDPHRCDELACSPQVKRRLRLPFFYGRPSPVLYRLFVPARHAKKWLKSTRQPKVRRPLGILLILVKSQNSYNSTYKHPITEPKKCTWSLLLSNISSHTPSRPPNYRPSSRYSEAVGKLSRRAGLCGRGERSPTGTSPPAQAMGALVALGYMPGYTLSGCCSSVSSFLCIAANWAGVENICTTGAKQEVL